MRIDTIIEKWVQATPEKAAVIIDDNVITYRELDEKIKLFAAALDKLGIRPGDKVSFYTENNLFTIYAYLGCFRQGVIAIPSSYFCTTEELAYESNSCQTEIYFVSRELYPKVKPLKEISTVRRIVVIDGPADSDDISWDELVRDLKPCPVDNEVDLEAPAMIFYTSGSTAKPKGVIHSQKSIMAIVKARGKTLRHTSSDIMMTTGFLCHASAFGIALLPMLDNGGTAVFSILHDEISHIELMKRCNVTHMGAAPIEWQRLTSLPSSYDNYFANLVYATTGGDAPSPKIQERFQALAGIPLVSSLGMTECGGYMTTPPHIPARKGSIGRPVDGVQVRLVDEDFVDVPLGETGQIIVKGDNVTLGYYNDVENTRAAFHDGWFLTGDMASRDEDGFYYFRSRIKNIIVHNAGNIHPVEVESALTKHPEIEAAVVVGVPSEAHGEDVYAFVVPRDLNNHPSHEELNNFAETLISFRKLPHYYHFLETIPNDNALHKADMKLLKKMAVETVEQLRAEHE